MTVLAVLLGAGLVLVGLRDIFQQLFRPHGSGSLSRLIMRAVWRSFARFAPHRPASLVLAGPCVLLTIIATWIVLLVTGWALIFWPYLPEGFRFATGLAPSEGDGFVDALYLSLMTLTTLGYGDITPTTGLLRLLAMIEALVGFGLLTAAISWVLSIYPALSRRQSLAQEISLTHQAESETGIDGTRTNPGATGRMLDSLASRLFAVRGDLLQFPVTYYFYSSEERSSLPAQMPTLVRFAQKGESVGCAPEVRLRAAVLRAAIEDFSATIASRFLGLNPVSTDSVLAAYARDHLRAPPGDGAHRVTRSEQQAGEGMVRPTVTRSLPGYLDLGGDEALVEVEAPREWAGKPFSELRLPRRGLTVLLLRHKGGGGTVAGEGTILREGDTMVIWGSKEDLRGSNLLGGREVLGRSVAPPRAWQGKEKDR